MVGLLCGAVLVLTLLPVVLAGEYFNLWAASQSLLITLFAGECIVSNGLRLRLAVPTIASTVLVVSMVGGIFVSVYWSLTVAIGRSGSPVDVVQSGLAFAGAYVVVAVLTVGATTCIFVGPERPFWTYDRCLKGAFQDTLLLLPMWMLMAWLPLMVAVHIPGHQNDLYSMVMIGAVFVGFMALYIGVLTWITQVNNAHVGREIENLKLSAPEHFSEEATHVARVRAFPQRLKDYSWNAGEGNEDEQRIRALSTHTAVQDTLAFMIAAFTVLGFFWLLPAEID
jgi:hypothetical protein